MCVFVRAFHAKPSLSCRFAAYVRTAMTRDKNRISVIGSGFVGLSSATVNAKMRFDTIGIDIDSEKIDNLKACRPDFFEPKHPRHNPGDGSTPLKLCYVCFSVNSGNPSPRVYDEEVFTCIQTNSQNE